MPKEVENATSSSSWTSTCASAAWTASVSATAMNAVTAHTTLTYDVALESFAPKGCAPRAVFLIIDTDAAPSLIANAVPNVMAVGSGQTSHFTVALTADFATKTGSYDLPFRVVDAKNRVVAQARLNYTLRPHHDCVVDPARELLIRDLSVVDDPVRTTHHLPEDPRSGAWTFGRLLENLAGPSGHASAIVADFFATWQRDQWINNQKVAARPAIDWLVLTPWPRSADGALDLAQAPLRLLAIVNRIDLRDVARHHAGEGRFVFGVLGPGGLPTPFTIILEYQMHAASRQEVLQWAQAWHALGQITFPSEAYNAALQRLTDRFTGQSSPSFRTLLSVRTNEFALATPWELRQFEVHDDPALHLRQSAVDLTPMDELLGTTALAGFVNQHEGDILRGNHRVPNAYLGTTMKAAAATNSFQIWQAPAILSASARRVFALGTCNGCHGAGETSTEFLHISPRMHGETASMSGFIRGIAVPDPLTGDVQIFNELGRRKIDLEALVCGCQNQQECAAIASEKAYRIH